MLADTFDGDELCFVPEDPEALYLLPRDDDEAVPLGPGLLSALDELVAGDVEPVGRGLDL